MFGQYVNDMIQNLVGDGMPERWAQSIGRVIGQCNAALFHPGQVQLPNLALPQLPLNQLDGSPQGARGLAFEGELQNDLTRGDTDPVDVEIWSGPPPHEAATGKRIKAWPSLMLDLGKTIPAGAMVKVEPFADLNTGQVYWKVTGSSQCGE